MSAPENLEDLYTGELQDLLVGQRPNGARAEKDRTENF